MSLLLETKRTADKLTISFPVNDMKADGTVQMVTQVLGQCGFRVPGWPIRVVAPAREFLSDEIHEFQLRSRWQMNVLAESA